jgi:hypothetical protein
MIAPTKELRDLASRLLALERSRLHPHDARVRAAARVLERLRHALTRFSGPNGFTVLLRRALSLARVEVPELEAVNVGANGEIEGLEALEHVLGDDSEGAVAIISHVLWLLVTFIGDPLVLRLVRDAWPEDSLDIY